MEEEDVGGGSESGAGLTHILGYSHHLLVILTILYGIWHLSESNAYPKFLNDWSVDYNVSGNNWDEIHEMKSQDWWSLQEKNITPYWKHQEVGWSLIHIALGIEFLMIVLGFQNMFRPRSANTPFSTNQVMVLSILSLWLAVPEQLFLLYHQSDRRDFPPWGDSLGIPTVGIVISAILITPFWILASYLLMRGSQFPSRIFSHKLFGRSVAKDLVVWVGIAFSIVLMIDLFGTEYAYLYPSGFLFIYVLLCLRAGNAKIESNQATEAKPLAGKHTH